jgi:predicted transcriptional regulator
MVRDRENLRNMGTEVERHSCLAERIVELLLANPKAMYSQGELAIRFKRAEQQIRQTCLTLVTKGIVDRLLDEKVSTRKPHIFYAINMDWARKRAIGIKKVEDTDKDEDEGVTPISSVK